MGLDDSTDLATGTSRNCPDQDAWLGAGVHSGEVLTTYMEKEGKPHDLKKMKKKKCSQSLGCSSNERHTKGVPLWEQRIM